MNSKKINNGLAIASLFTCVAAYQAWRYLWDDFCYQALGVALLLLFALGHNLGRQYFWVRKMCLIGVGISLYNLFDEFFLNPLHASPNEYVSAFLVVFFIFTPELYIFLLRTRNFLGRITTSFLLFRTIKALLNERPERRNGRIQRAGKKTGKNI